LKVTDSCRITAINVMRVKEKSQQRGIESYTIASYVGVAFKESRRNPSKGELKDSALEGAGYGCPVSQGEIPAKGN